MQQNLDILKNFLEYFYVAKFSVFYATKFIEYSISMSQIFKKYLYSKIFEYIFLSNKI